MGITAKYQAKPIDAVQVTEENIEEVAKWCGGKAVTLDETVGGTTVTKKMVKMARTQGTPVRAIPAYIGDWVICESGGRFRVFKEHIFKKIFSPVEKLTAESK